MPEIAEVRLIADNIESFLKNGRLVKIEILHPDIIFKYIRRNLKGIDTFITALTSNPLAVHGVYTKGKFCWIELQDNWFIMISFGMSGNVRIEPTESYLAEYNTNRSKPAIDRDRYLKHCHLKIYYKSIDNHDNHFYYHDIRRFGTWTFVQDRLQVDRQLQRLGHDPLNSPELTDADVIGLFRRFNHQNVCKALMSQQLIAGVGNYICSEVLYEAEIHPLAAINTIPDASLLVLYKAIRNIAILAYESGGASLYTYSGLRGDRTEFKNTLKVYGKSYDPFGNPVIRIPAKESPDRRTKFYIQRG